MGGTDGSMPYHGIARSFIDWPDLIDRLDRRRGARAGRGRRGAASGTRRPDLPGGRRGLLQEHGRRSHADRRRGQGPQHVAGVDRRQRPSMGQADQPDLRRVRSVEDPVLLSGAQIQPRQPVELSRSGQRAVLHKADRPRSAALRAVARRARSELPGRSVRQRAEVSGGRGRRPRQEHSARVLLRISDWDPRAAALPQPRLRSSGRGPMECRTLLQRPELLLVEGSGPAVPGRDVLRVLSRWTEPGKTAGEPRSSAMGEPQLHRRGAVFLGRPHFCVECRSVEFSVPGAPYRPSGLVGHLAGFERQHQQPAHDERRLQSLAAVGSGQTLRAGDLGSGQSGEQAVQRFRQPGTADPVLSAAEYSVDPACAERRCRFGRRARRTEPRLCEYRSIQRRVAAPFQPDRRRQAHHPLRDQTARKNSSYWQATETQTPDMALFLVKASYPHKLSNAPGGAAYLNDPPETVQQGKLVFADNCAACHSSKAPPRPAGADPAACIGPNYLTCFNKYWAWTQTDDFKQKMRQIVQANDFLDDNFLSNDGRVPVTLLQTNACSPLATNAIGGNVWDNFSSASYKQLPSVGAITVYDPFTGQPRQYQMPAGGRGYTRVPSLISLWSTAPYLLNNTVGKFNESPSVEARMGVFQDSITKMLWPDKRDKDKVLGDKIPGVIDRTTVTSWARIPTGYLPDVIKASREVLNWLVPVFDQKGIEIGPIPAGTPVDLLANFDPLPPVGASLRERVAHDKAVIKVIVQLLHDLKALPQGATDEQARQVFANAGEQLFALSKCPDYIVNRGHYFGTQLSDADKNALIAFLKTF